MVRVYAPASSANMSVGFDVLGPLRRLTSSA